MHPVLADARSETVQNSMRKIYRYSIILMHSFKDCCTQINRYRSVWNWIRILKDLQLKVSNPDPVSEIKFYTIRQKIVPVPGTGNKISENRFTVQVPVYF
jgi:hypothetical protein